MFLHKPVRHGSLTLPFEPFRFWLRILGDIRNQKMTPRIGESGSRQDCLELPFFQTFRLFNCDSKLHPWPIFCQICTFKAWFSHLKFWKSTQNYFLLLVSTIRGVDDSPYHWYGESAKRSESFDNDVFFDIEAKRTPSIVGKFISKPSEHVYI